MATVPALVDRTPAQRLAEIRDEEALWGDLRPELARLVKTVLETTMEDELRLAVGALRYERTSGRRDHRNGCYRRSLVTELGLIEALAVPRARELRYRPSFLAHAARRTSAGSWCMVTIRIGSRASPSRRRRSTVSPSMSGSSRSSSTTSMSPSPARRSASAPLAASPAIVTPSPPNMLRNPSRTIG